MTSIHKYHISYDILKAFYLALSQKSIHQYFIDNFILTPIGSIIIFMILFGINKLILKIGVEFPSSVLLMILLYFTLLILSSNKLIGSKKIKIFLINDKNNFLIKSMNFALRWINVCFIPSFVSLPLAKKVGIIEAVIIAAVFIIGYVIGIIFVCFTVKGLQMVIGKPRRALVERDEVEMETTIEDTTNDETKLRLESENKQVVDENKQEQHTRINSYDTIETIEISEPPNASVIARARSSIINDDNISRSVVSLQTTPGIDFEQLQFQHNNTITPRCIAYSSIIIRNIDWIIYSVFTFIGIIIYFTTSYSIILDLGITMLTYFIALNIPLKIRRIAHPIIVSAAMTVLIIFLLALVKTQNISDFLKSIEKYKTGRNYLHLFDNDSKILPGAGDVLSSMMDISIVSLSIPMYTYRNDLKKHFLTLMIPILIFSCMTFFLYPIICFNIGISSTNSLGFVGRSVTLALGTPLITSISGSVTLMSITTLLSGILGVILGPFMFGPYMLRVAPDDYVTRGITLGVNGGAVSTAYLLTIDPRASAMSSLSFVIFGTVLLIMGAIPSIRQIIQNYVDINAS